MVCLCVQNRAHALTVSSAICLSTLHAPAPPEPAKLSDEPVTDEAARPPSIRDATITEPEVILKLQVCQHEFHADCLVSWFVLRKTSCPICRAEYYSKEAMQELEAEDQAAIDAATPSANIEAQAPAPVVSNWRYFVRGRDVFRNQNRDQTQTGTQRTIQHRGQTQDAVEMEAMHAQSRFQWQRFRG